MKSRLLRLADPVVQSAPVRWLVFTLVKLWASSASRRPPADGIRELLVLDDHLQRRVDLLAIDLDGGIHAKHRLTGYHEFFVDRVGAGDRVLDVGCGKGELAYDLAVRTHARVTGLDFEPVKLEFARARFEAPGLEFVEGDALDWDPSQPYDVVVLSNVLEHIAPRVDLLRRLHDRTGARRFLIRVPSIERDWLVALKREVGLDAYGDPTHETEYTVDQLHAELGAAGLRVADLVQRWGELWAEARAGDSSDPGLS
jgi:SAM-dependent methyltransferase